MKSTGHKTENGKSRSLAALGKTNSREATTRIGAVMPRWVVMVFASALVMATVVVGVVARTQEQKKPEGQKSSATSTTKQELIDLENQWVDALQKADAAALDGILADTYADAEGNQRSDKKGVLAELKSGDLKIGSIKLSDMRVYNYGDAAVVTGVGEQTGTFKGQALAGKVFFTDTFVKRNGKWKAVASHRSAG